jgi:hypothetical protein
MKISGQVLDSKGEGLSLANITITSGDKAEKLGVVADLDGNFSTENDLIKPDSTFRISYVGFIPQLFKASELDNKKITLIESNELLSQVDVFSQPKRTAKQSVSALKAHIQNNKFAYAGIGGLLGLFLIAKSIKK